MSESDPLINRTINMNLSDLVTQKDWLLLAVGGIVGYLASMLVAKQTAKKKNLILETTGRRIIVEAADACPFDILDKHGNQLSNVYLISVRIWNKGNEHIVRSDISNEAPLRVMLLDDAHILGEPIIFRGGSEIGLQLSEEKKNTYQIIFECVNPGEWAELGFFVKDNPRIRLAASGRLFGQESEFAFRMDDGRAFTGERLAAMFAMSFLVASPIALVTGLVFLLKDYSVSALLFESATIPEHIKQCLAFGAIIPAFVITYYMANWFKRKRNPKTYPLDEDYEPSQAQNIGAMWGTALSGRRYRVSASVHSTGEIIVPNQAEASNTSVDRTA